VYAFSQDTQKEFLDLFNVLDVQTNLILEDENKLNFRIKAEQVFNLLETTEKPTENIEESQKLLIENLSYEKEFIDELINLYKENQENKIIEKLAQKEKIEDEKSFEKLFSYINFSKNVLNLKPEKEIIISFLDKICYKENTNINTHVELISGETDKEFEY
ncbi:hypothetical protein IKA92_03855, partial [bacterium]|nr:hypothetical protein [bacterium]